MNANSWPLNLNYNLFKQAQFIKYYVKDSSDIIKTK